MWPPVTLLKAYYQGVYIAQKYFKTIFTTIFYLTKLFTMKQRLLINLRLLCMFVICSTTMYGQMQMPEPVAKDHWQSEFKDLKSPNALLDGSEQSPALRQSTLRFDCPVVAEEWEGTAHVHRINAAGTWEFDYTDAFITALPGDDLPDKDFLKQNGLQNRTSDLQGILLQNFFLNGEPGYVDIIEGVSSMKIWFDNETSQVIIPDQALGILVNLGALVGTGDDWWEIIIEEVHDIDLASCVKNLIFTGSLLIGQSGYWFNYNTFNVTAITGNLLGFFPATGAPNAEALVDMFANNTTDFASFELDVILPSEMSFINGSAYLNPDRITNHQLETSITGNTLHITASSPDNSPFSGSTGHILSFGIQTSSQMGVYTLEIENAVMFDTQGNSLDTQSQNGQLTIETSAEQPQGSGTQNEPYLIASLGNLLWMSQQASTPEGTYFLQTEDIDASETMNWNDGEGWHSIMNFAGNYDGAGHVISNLYANNPNNSFVALFGTTNTGAVLENIHLHDVYFAGYSRVATLVGRANNTVIVNCSATGTVMAQNNWSGGLIGVLNSESTLQNSFAAVDVTAQGFSIGGLCGTAENNCTIENSYATGSVHGLRNVGGLVGWMANSNVLRCYSTGQVSGDSDTNLGGLIGFGSNTSYSYWNIETSGQSASAGGEPKNTEQMLTQGTFADWDFNSTWSIEQNTTYPYLSWQVSPGDHNYPDAFLPPSNLEATPANEAITLHWDAPSTGNPDSYNIYRNHQLLHTQDASQLTFTNTGLTNYTIYTYYVTAVYGAEESAGSNIATMFPNPGFAGGDGSSANPYLVSNAGELFTVRLYLEGHFRQTQDIDLYGTTWYYGAGWQPIGSLSDPFTGNFDGDHHTIQNLRIYRPQENYIGLFGITSQATLENMVMENVDVYGLNRSGGIVGQTEHTIITACHVQGIISSHGSGAGGIAGLANLETVITESVFNGNLSGFNHVGGIAGTLNASNSIISGCHASGEASGNNHIGGIAGWVASLALVDQSFSTINISGTGRLGGLAGYVSNSSIHNSYATGTMTGGYQVGGAIGCAVNSNVSESYSTGGVVGYSDLGGFIGYSEDNDFYNVFWSVETSGMSTCPEAIGLNLEQMTQQVSFSDFDFASIWGIAEEESFPYLKWQNEPWSHNYPPIAYSLDLIVTPEGAGSVEGAGDYYQGAGVELTATAHDGYVFQSWRKDGVTLSTEPQFAYVMPGHDVTLAAYFVQDDTELFALNLFANPSNGGTVQGSGQFAQGEEAHIQAQAHHGWKFVQWESEGGEVVSTQESFTHVMPGHHLNLYAIFSVAGSVDHISTPQIQMYPNPANTQFTVKADGIIEELTVMDITGRIMLSKQVGDTQANISAQHLKAGIYMVRIATDQQIITQKLMINK